MNAMEPGPQTESPGDATSTQRRLNRSLPAKPGLGCERDLLAAPDLDQRLRQRIHQFGAVVRTRREAQALGAPRYGREIDGLNVQPIFGEQDVADPFRLDRAADEQ